MKGYCLVMGWIQNTDNNQVNIMNIVCYLLLSLFSTRYYTPLLNPKEVYKNLKTANGECLMGPVGDQNWFYLILLLFERKLSSKF